MEFNKRNSFNFEDDLLGEQAVNKFLVDFFYKKFKEIGYIIDFEVSRELNTTNKNFVFSKVSYT